MNFIIKNPNIYNEISEICRKCIIDLKPIEVLFNFNDGYVMLHNYFICDNEENLKLNSIHIKKSKNLNINSDLYIKKIISYNIKNILKNNNISIETRDNVAKQKVKENFRMSSDPFLKILNNVIYIYHNDSKLDFCFVLESNKPSIDELLSNKWNYGLNLTISDAVSLLKLL